jgi:hypothetical protein
VSGGWQAFREASRTKATVDTAAGELERPVVSHRISPDGGKPLEVHETTPDIVPVLPGDAEASTPAPVTPESETPEADKPESESTDRGPDDPAAEDQDPDKLFQQAMDMMPAWTAPASASRLRTAMAPLAPHWYVAAIVPVAAAASLLAVWAGVNPYALCLQWWDFLYGSIFLAASLLFIALAVLKGPRGAWHPGAPALIVVVGVIPFWVATNVAFGSACQAPSEFASASMLAPLPPPIEVPSYWTVPMPMPRPPELHYQFSPHQLDLRLNAGIELQPPNL